jgi:hypothetical protein
MTKYALFAWCNYDAAGGINDLRHIGTMDECKAVGDKLLREPNGYKQLEIVEVGTLRGVLEVKHFYEPSPLTGHPAKEWHEWASYK